MIGQFRKELVSTDWINSRFHPENCFWALNHIYHARNSLALWFVVVLFVALNIFLSMACTYCYLFANSVTDGNVCTKKFFFFLFSRADDKCARKRSAHSCVLQKKKSFEQQVNEWIITIEIIGKTYFLWIFESLVA